MNGQSRIGFGNQLMHVGAKIPPFAYKAAQREENAGDSLHVPMTGISDCVLNLPMRTFFIDVIYVIRSRKAYNREAHSASDQHTPFHQKSSSSSSKDQR